MTNTATGTTGTLTAAYHALYDFKDAQEANGGNDSPRYVTYEALGKLAEVMTLMGIPVPNRFDATR